MKMIKLKIMLMGEGGMQSRRNTKEASNLCNALFLKLIWEYIIIVILYTFLFEIILSEFKKIFNY